MIYSKCFKMLYDYLEEDFKTYEPDSGGSFSFSSPGSSISDLSSFSPNWDGDDDFLECVKYDEIELEKNPALFTCVSPVHLSPVHPFTGAPITLPEPPTSHSIVDMSPTVPWEEIIINDFPDDIINGIEKSDINSSFFDMAINSPLKPTPVCDADHCATDDLINVPKKSLFSHLDVDHCYSAPPKPEEKEEEEEIINSDCYSSPASPDSSETSSEEVDVVTVPEELILIVPKVEVTHRSTRKRGRKTVKKAQNPLTHKCLKAAMKNNRITNIRRTYRRKVSNSVETSPSNSVPSSAQSSRCNSDAEDAGKRANHNSSERKRREILRNNLQNLRISVPTTQDNPKAPKVLILNSAAEYINELISDEQDLVYLKKLEDQIRKQKEAELKSLISYFKRRC